MLLCYNVFMIRTTVRLDDNLFKEARKLAIDHRVAFMDIVNQALSLYLRKPRKVQNARKKKFNTNDFLAKLTTYKFHGPTDLAKNHDKYAWE